MCQKTEAAHLQEILKRVSDYLDALAGHVFDIEETVGRTVSNSVKHDDLAIKNLQVLDFLRQSLEDLALLATAIGDPRLRPIGEEAIQSIGSKLKLKSTRSLLTDNSTEGVQTISKNLGELDLF